MLTPTVTKVQATSDPVILVSAAVHRLSAGFFNDSNKILFIKYGMDPDFDSYSMKIWPQQFFSIYPAYRGEITGFWEEGAAGFAMITVLETGEN